MAKADDTSSRADKIFLFKALVLAIARFGTESLAKRMLRKWMASGELPWSSRSWWGPDAETIARLDRENTGIVGYFVPSGPYHRGDPRFWLANLEIKWEENKAGEIAKGGAGAEGIWVTYSRLLALLPEKLRKREETLRQTQPAAGKLMAPKAWLADALKKNPRRKNEDQTAYARRIHALMQEANVTRHWSPDTLLRRLYDK